VPHRRSPRRCDQQRRAGRVSGYGTDGNGCLPWGRCSCYAVATWLRPGWTQFTTCTLLKLSTGISPISTSLCVHQRRPASWAIEQRLNANRERVRELLASVQNPTWDNFVAPMQQWDDELNQAWSPVGHLNGVLNSDELRDAYNACLPLLSAYSTEMGQNKDLCNAWKKLRDSAEYPTLSKAQQKAIDNALRDFHLAGVDLPAEKKARYGEIRKRLSELTSKFGENVLDATNAWSKLITD